MATRKPKALPGKQGGSIGKGGVVTRHGVTTTGYQRGCRCKLCVQAMADYARAARERAGKAKKAKTTPTVKVKPTTAKRRQPTVTSKRTSRKTAAAK